MEKSENIIKKIRELQTMQPPDNLVGKIMNGVDKIENSAVNRFIFLFFQPLEYSTDIKNIISGHLVSYRQCAFLLFIVGLFYLLLGILVIWGLQGALQWENINLWLKIQPYIAVASAILIIIMSLLILLYSQKIVNVAKYFVIMHVAFITVDAIILESTMFSSGALIFTIVITTMAIIMGMILINYLQSFLKNNPSSIRHNCDQNA